MEVRQPLPDGARVELTNRYRARAMAELSLVSYLKGLVDGMGIAPETVAGFDDQTGELLVTIPDPPSDPPPDDPPSSG